MYYYHPHTGRFEKNTRSTIRASTVGPVSRRGYDDDLYYVPKRTSVLTRYDTTSNEYNTAADINKELIMSSAAMEDNYDISNRSRQRDRDVIAAANRAIVNTETHTSPRSAVAARRVLRGRSMPPAPSYVTTNEVHVAIARARPNTLRYSVPPASAPPSPRLRLPRVNVKPWYKNYATVRSTRNVLPSFTRGLTSTDIEGQRRAPLSLLAYLRNLDLALRTKRYKPRSTWPIRPSARKAALLASKVETMLPPRKRHPKSAYAQAKIRQMRRDKRDSGEVEVVAAAPAVTIQETSTLRASPPVPSHPNLNKPMWDADGHIKRPNIMSWKYRLDTYLSPDDLIILPKSLGSVKQQLRECQNKLDRHRQLVDRYLVTDKGLTPEEHQVLMNIRRNAYQKEAALQTDVTKPSDRVKKTRRKLQKKHNMEY